MLFYCVIIDTHKYLVEPACGAALAAVYGDTLDLLQRDGHVTKTERIVVIVCGGSCVTLDDLMNWKKQFKLVSPSYVVEE